jgi:hypothetical protein
MAMAVKDRVEESGDWIVLSMFAVPLWRISGFGGEPKAYGAARGSSPGRLFRFRKSAAALPISMAESPGAFVSPFDVPQGVLIAPLCARHFAG